MDANYRKIKTLAKTAQHRFNQASGDSLVVHFEKNNLKEITSKQNNSYQLEVINKGKIGTASANSFDSRQLYSKAFASSAFGDKVSYTFPKTKSIGKVKSYSKKVVAIKPQEFVKLGQELIEIIEKADKDILVNVRLARTVASSIQNNSSGFTHQSQETHMAISAEGELVNEGDILTIGDYWSWDDYTFDAKKFAEPIAEKFKLSKKMVDIPSGKYTVILMPEVLTNLVEFYQTALSAQSVYKKTSKWIDQIGKQVADPRITLIDDPTIDFASSSTPCDDEGFEAKPLTLIEKGILKEFYSDLKYADKLKIKPNGRGFGIPASPDMTNVCFLGDKKTFKEMIKGIESGILIEQVIGGGQDSPFSGDLSLNIHLGFLIKNGELVGRVKNCLMSGNAFDMLRSQVAEITSERVWYAGSFYTPYMSFTDVTIASKR